MPRAVRTLILLGSSLTALAVARVAHRRGLRCVMLDSTPGSAAPTRGATFRRLRNADMASVTESTRDLPQDDTVAVVADSDRWLRFVSAHRAELSAGNRRVLHPSSTAIDICLDKSAFLRWCEQHDLAAPRWYEPHEAEALDASAYPLMLRPEWTQHSTPTGLPKAIEIREASQLRYWLDRYRAVAVTPSICTSLLRPGLRQFSVGAARDAKGRVRTFLAEKVRPQAEQCAGGTFVRPAVHPAAEQLAARALDAIEFFGVAEVEVLFDPATQAAHLIEINARPWLQFGLPYACGCDLFGHVFEEAAGNERPADLSHAWLYFSSDLYACFARDTGLLTQSKMGFAEYLGSLVRADVYATWDWRDPLPLLASASQAASDWIKQRLRRS
jgi:predicted ATP-grasp superfamily ATP-dependent carboligase